jgi:hypothetical protein
MRALEHVLERAEGDAPEGEWKMGITLHDCPSRGRASPDRASGRGELLATDTRTMRVPATSNPDVSARPKTRRAQCERCYAERLLIELSADVKLRPGLAIGPNVNPSALSSCSTRSTI